MTLTQALFIYSWMKEDIRGVCHRHLNMLYGVNYIEKDKDSKGSISKMAYWDVASEVAIIHVNINRVNIRKFPEQSHQFAVNCLEVAMTVDATYRLQHIVDH